MSEKLRTIRLYGPLGAKFGREFKLYVSTPAEAIRALSLQLKGFEAFMKNPAYNYAVLVGKRPLNLATKLDELHEPPGSQDIRIAPVPAGAKRGGLLQAVLGAALIVASFYTGGLAAAGYMSAASAASLGSGMLAAGIGLSLGGIAQMLSPQPKLNLGDESTRASEYFSGPAQTTAQGNPVPICYGEGIIGSVPISAGIYAEDMTT